MGSIVGSMAKCSLISPSVIAVSRCFATKRLSVVIEHLDPPVDLLRVPHKCTERGLRSRSADDIRIVTGGSSVCRWQAR
jgi:hypothetical protein